MLVQWHEGQLSVYNIRPASHKGSWRHDITWSNLYQTNIDHKPKLHVVTSLVAAVCTENSSVLSNAVFTTTSVYSEQQSKLERRKIYANSAQSVFEIFPSSHGAQSLKITGALTISVIRQCFYRVTLCYTQSIEWCHIQWPWLAFDWDFKVAISRSDCLSDCLSVCLTVCLSFCLSDRFRYCVWRNEYVGALFVILLGSSF